VKAKEYVTLWQTWQGRLTKGDVYHNAPKEEKDEPAELIDYMSKLCHELLKEFKSIVAMRRASRPEALGSIVAELIQKYEAICRRVPELTSGFFKVFIDSFLEGERC